MGIALVRWIVGGFNNNFCKGLVLSAALFGMSIPALQAVDPDGGSTVPINSLPDFSTAGYHRGEGPLQVATSSTFTFDSTFAQNPGAKIQEALQNNRTVQLPAGTYDIDRALLMSGKNNIILRGAKSNGQLLTTLRFTRSCSQLFEPGGQDTTNHGKWHNNGGLIGIGKVTGNGQNGGSSSSEIGIEDLIIDFNRTRRPTAELGYNAILFNHASNCYVKNVKIFNFDAGINVKRSSHITSDTILLNSSGTVSGYTGIHGAHLGVAITEGSAYNLTSNVNIVRDIAHDYSVYNADWNVFKNSNSAAGAYDGISHRGGNPANNLFCNLNLAEDAFGTSNGSGTDKFGRFEYYWNVSNARTTHVNCRVYWNQPVADLHQAQLNARLGTDNGSNIAPVVQAGPDQIVTLGSGGNIQVSLSGRVSDDNRPAGGSLSTLWSKQSGPRNSAVAFSNASQSATRAIFTMAGTYVLRLRAHDGQLASSDDVQITVHPAGSSINLAPIVQAGADQSVTLTSAGNISIALTGRVSDDDKPVGGILNKSWTKVSGPANAVVSFSHASQPVSRALFNTAGIYVLRLTANDGLLSTSDDVRITVSADPGGVPTSVIYEAERASLSGARVDDDHVVLRNDSGDSIQWTVQSNGGSSVLDFRYAMPTPETFLEVRVNNSVVAAALKFKRTGGWNRYLTTSLSVNLPQGACSIRLKETQRGGLHVDYLRVNGSAAPVNLAPLVSAGPDQSAILSGAGNVSVTLAGSVSDDDRPIGGTLTKFWSKVSGPIPSTVNFANASQSNTRAFFNIAGTYVLRLSANDGSLSAHDEVRITISSTETPNRAPVVQAGPDQTVNLTNAGTVSVALAGRVTDDNKPVGSTLTRTWTRQSGPANGTVSFADASLPTSRAAFSVSGTYVLRLTAHDGSLTSNDEVQITVNSNTPSSSGNWMMVCQPDTQYLSSGNANGFNAQTAWIARHAALKNIRHVFHLGDMVDNSGTNSQWTHAVTAMNNLSPIMPDVAVSLTIGNHDFDTRFVNTSTVRKWASRFGNNYRLPYSWYYGSSNATNEDEDRNHYCKFTAGGYQFLSMDIQWNPRPEDLAWAANVLARNPHMPTILGTHAYLNDAGGDNINGPGQTIWDNLVKHHPQIFLVVNGHSSTRGSGSRYNVRNNTSRDNNLRPVIEMVADFQAEGNGNNGRAAVSWVKLLTFEMGNNKIHFQTYNPSGDAYVTGNRQDHYEDINFAQRFNL